MERVAVGRRCGVQRSGGFAWLDDDIERKVSPGSRAARGAVRARQGLRCRRGAGAVTAVRQPGKREPWRTGYDEIGQMISQETPAGKETRYTYFDNRLLKSVADPRKNSYTAIPTPAGVPRSR
jgi:YD repeat-containing protein